MSKQKRAVTVAILTLAVIVIAVTVYMTRDRNPTNIGADGQLPHENTQPVKPGETPGQELSYCITSTLYDEGTIYEVRVDNETGNAALYKDGKLSQDLQRKQSKSWRLNIPDFWGIKADELNPDDVYDPTELNKADSALTWKIEAGESQLLIYTKLIEGWVVKRQTTTPQYCEVYLFKGDKTMRAIIFPHTLIAGEVSETGYQSVEDCVSQLIG